MCSPAPACPMSLLGTPVQCQPPPGGEDLGVTKPRRGWSSRQPLGGNVPKGLGDMWHWVGGHSGNEDLGGTLIHSLLLPHRGLVSHCIAILKVSPGGGTGDTCGTGAIRRPPGPTLIVPSTPQICHTLTEKLVAMTMGSGARVKSPSSLGDIIVVAKRISPR